jgi:tRNA-Thr(GGU) m(6)t(6)A37 methyltransferase TsaA
LTPIGVLRTPFATLDACPRNGRAIDPAPECLACVDPAFAEGLDGIAGFTHLILLYWLGRQAPGWALVVRPKFDRQPRGVFSTRSPRRPNPIGLSVVKFDGFADPATLRVRYLDCVDGTALLDIKPYLPRSDAEPGASMGWLARGAGASPTSPGLSAPRGGEGIGGGDGWGEVRGSSACPAGEDGDA